MSIYGDTYVSIYGDTQMSMYGELGTHRRQYMGTVCYTVLVFSSMRDCFREILRTHKYELEMHAQNGL